MADTELNLEAERAALAAPTAAQKEGTTEQDVVVLKMPMNQAKELSEALYNTQDCGPPGEGWASDEVEALRKLVDGAIDAAMSAAQAQPKDTTDTRRDA